MHHARLQNSPRLRRALKALQQAQGTQGGEMTTWELSRAADICAVNSTVAELRENGAEIACRQAFRDGRRRFFYRLIRSPKGY